jgi:hypothetical protein
VFGHLAVERDGLLEVRREGREVARRAGAGPDVLPDGAQFRPRLDERRRDAAVVVDGLADLRADRALDGVGAWCCTSASADSSARNVSSATTMSRAITDSVAICLARVSAPPAGILVRASQARTDLAFSTSLTCPMRARSAA